MIGGRYIPSVSAWAFSGAKAGESSELYDAPDASVLARLDTVAQGGTPTLEDSKADIRRPRCCGREAGSSMTCPVPFASCSTTSRHSTKR